MTIQKPFHTTPHGGSIVCLQGLTGRMFRACSLNKCTYTADLHAAKSYLDCLENKKVKFLPSPRNKDCIPVQRKTTLKWNADGSLSSVDMARILSRLENESLTECELSCEWGSSN